MVNIRNLSLYKGKDCFPEYIAGINTIRANCEWSEKKNYDVDNIGNVHLILYDGQMVGFIECTYKNLDIYLRKKVKLFLHTLHIAPSMQGKGVGTEILEHLLSKGLDIEMVVANDNKNMLKLVGKFKNDQKHINEDTRTIILKSLL